MEYWLLIAPALEHSIAPFLPLLGMALGYALLMWFNPIRLSFRDGLRCLARFERVWLTFAVLGFAYSIFQFVTFTPLTSTADLDMHQVGSIATWHWPKFVEVWGEVPLPVLEGLAGLFDNAATTYPLSVVAAVMMLFNWRRLHGGFYTAVRKRFGFWGFLIYTIVLLSAFATLMKPIVFWRLPLWEGEMASARLVQISATVDASAFIFEYLFGVYIQVYLITVCLAWIKGLSFTEPALFQFAMRRFSYVLEWAGVVVIVSTLLVRVPLLLAYFREIPNVLDWLPLQRAVMGTLLILFCSVQISLVLHNEKLREAIRAHWEFLRRNAGRFGWFLLIAGLQFFILVSADAIMRGAIADRTPALLMWKALYVLARAFVTGWLLASWVCLFRQCETARIGQE
ncbi:MAG: hypothetical protein ACJ8KU_08640, partial [Chthoniobacterales bacterium]